MRTGGRVGAGKGPLGTQLTRRQRCLAPGLPHVDLAARTGWLVRTSRLHRVEGSRLLTDLAEELGAAPGTLSRWETGQARLTGAQLERLDVVLPATAGSLRGLVALLHRQLGSSAAGGLDVPRPGRPAR